MRVLTGLVALAVLLLGAGPCRAAGIRFIDIPAGDGGAAIEGAVWSPCAGPAGTVHSGLLALPGTPDCPINGDHLPLVVISHGFSGRFTSHHDTAEALAGAGFIVVAVNHPVDSGPDMRRADTLAWFTERAADIRRTIDYMLGAWPGHASIDPDRIGFFGFSRGGYTGLVLIGATPELGQAAAICTPDLNPICGKLHDGMVLPTQFPHDPRIRAAVIADPALPPVFTQSALRNVQVPVQLWASQWSGDDPHIGVTADGVARLRDALPTPPDFHLVANAGHYSFLTPCPPALASRLPQLCTDRPGFDRVAFHQALDAAAVTFFENNLAAGHAG